MKNDLVGIITCDPDNRKHSEALTSLLNEYILDKMGGGEPYNEEQKKRLIQGLKTHPSKLIYLAESGSQYIGLALCFVNFATFTVKPFINIHDIIVTSDWRNKGVGRRLLGHIMKIAEEMDCSKVTLEVREDNLNAQALYKSLGFNDAKPRQFYWSKIL